MAVKNEAVSSLTDLVTKLDTYMQTRGWTSEHLDTASVDSNSGEWAMRKGNVRFAAKWDAQNSPTKIALYHYSDQNYVIGDRPWGQDHDSGNGAASHLQANIEGARHIVVTATPIQYWAFDAEGLGSYMHITVETSTGIFAHFGFGELNKRGDWVGGEYVYGQFNNNTGISGGIISVDGSSFLLDGFLNDGSGIVNAELYAATIHCEDLPNQAANGMYAVSVGGTVASPQTDFGLDRQSNDGSSSDTARVMFLDGVRNGTWAAGLSRTSSVDLSGEIRMWPVAPRYFDSTTGDTYGPMGFMADVFGCNIQHAPSPGSIITDENNDQYYIFPAEEKWLSGTDKSGNLGIAYRVSTAADYTDPGLPAAVNDPVAWYSSRSSDDYTLVSNEITVMKDKSSNGNDLDNADHTGPGVVTIDGRVWFNFSRSVPNAVGGPSSFSRPDSGDYACFVVYKSTATDQGTLFGAIGGGDPDFHYGLFVARSNARSLYCQIRDAGVANISILEDDSGTPDYTDDTARMCGHTYDDSIADHLLFGDDWDNGQDVDSDLVYNSGAISPTNDVYIGVWDVAGTHGYEGQIAEVLVYDRPLTAESDRQALRDYLKTKWGIT